MKLKFRNHVRELDTLFFPDDLITSVKDLEHACKVAETIVKSLPEGLLIPRTFLLEGNYGMSTIYSPDGKLYPIKKRFSFPDDFLSSGHKSMNLQLVYTSKSASDPFIWLPQGAKRVSFGPEGKAISFYYQMKEDEDIETTFNLFERKVNKT